MRSLIVSPGIKVKIDPACPPGVAFLLDSALDPPQVFVSSCHACGYDLDLDGYCSFCGKIAQIRL